MLPKPDIFICYQQNYEEIDILGMYHHLTEPRIGLGDGSERRHTREE